jgi:hypothetical protein
MDSGAIADIREKSCQQLYLTDAILLYPGKIF